MAMSLRAESDLFGAFDAVSVGELYVREAVPEIISGGDLAARTFGLRLEFGATWRGELRPVSEQVARCLPKRALANALGDSSVAAGLARTVLLDPKNLTALAALMDACQEVLDAAVHGREPRCLHDQVCPVHGDNFLHCPIPESVTISGTIDELGIRDELNALVNGAQRYTVMRGADVVRRDKQVVSVHYDGLDSVE